MANDIIPLQFRQSRLNHLPCGNGGAAAIVNSATNLSSSYIVALLLLLLIHSSDDCSSSDSVLKIEKECNFFVKSISQKFREIGFTKKILKNCVFFHDFDHYDVASQPPVFWLPGRNSIAPTTSSASSPPAASTTVAVLPAVRFFYLLNLHMIAR